MGEKKKRAKRPDTLPVFGNGEEWGVGELVDESLNSFAEKLIQDLQPEFQDDLAEWFRSKLIGFRVVSEDLASSPTPREEAQLVRDAQRYLHEVVQRLENLPPITQGLVDQESFSRGKRFFHDDRLPKFVAMSDEINALLESAGRRLEELPTKPGRSSEFYRDQLLSNTADWLIANAVVKIKKAKAAEIAGNILRAANIPVPANCSEIERRISKHKKGPNTP